MNRFDPHRLVNTTSDVTTRLLKGLVGALVSFYFGGRRTRKIYITILLFVFLLGLLGPIIAPYPPDEPIYEGSELIQEASPSADHLFGTNNRGYDIFSRVLYGARPTLVTGVVAATMIISIGGTVGVIAGYVGGTVDNFLMRITDIMYTFPMIPVAIILSSFLKFDVIGTAFIIGIVLWRGNARVLRSQVLQIKERPFIRAAQSMGASTPRIIVSHILPNIAPMAVLFFALALGYSIVLQAGLSFIGVTNPFIPTWGIMIRNAYDTGRLVELWFWITPPSVLVSLTVMSAFMLGRSVETDTEESEDEVMLQGG